VYVPNARHATLFEKKGEYKATAYALQVADVQLAYAVSNHVAIMANGATNIARSFPEFRFGELGIGYFTKAKEFNVEFFGGYGAGASTANFNNKMVARDYNRIFLSQSVGQKSNRFQWSVTNRFSLVDFTTFQSSDPISTRSSKVFIEPGMYSGYSLIKEKLFFVVQAGVAAHLGNSPYFDYSPFYFSAGLNWQVSK